MRFHLQIIVHFMIDHRQGQLYISGILEGRVRNLEELLR